MKKQYMQLSCQVACAFLLSFATQVWADEQVVEPTYQNDAQAAHDANLTDAFYETNPEIASLVDQINNEPDENIKADLEDQLETLLEEEGYADPRQVSQMRADGMGWGEIAHALGVHPGVLGLGHSKQFTKQQEMAYATSTNLKTGYSKGHEKAYQNAGMNKGNNGNKGGNKENNGNKGSNKGGNGNKGGNKGGNGKGEGNGKNK